MLIISQAKLFSSGKDEKYNAEGDEGTICVYERKLVYIAPDYGELRCCVQRQVVWGFFHFTKNKIIVSISQVT